MNRAQRVSPSGHSRLTARRQETGRQTDQSLKSRFCSRHHFVWLFLILLVVCFTIQTFVSQMSRGNKLMRLPLPRSSFNKQTPFPDLPVDLLPESPLEEEQRSEQTANLHHQRKGDEEHSDDRLMQKIISVSQKDAGNGLKSGSDKMLINTSTTHRDRVPSTTTCRPRSHIVFLKTHKTASSSILNILYRYGESRNLTFALPRNKHSQMFYPLFFDSHFVEGFSSRNRRDFHIMCNHMRFRKSEVSKVMPEETFYFSILRHPVAMMESIFTYYKNIPAFNKAPSLDKFLDNCWTDYNSTGRNNHYAHNALAFDFGLDNNVAGGAEDLEERAAGAVTAIERDFHLVLISDYFDESMILLKHVLCWSLEDVVSFRVNSRSKQTRHRVSPQTAAKVTRWNALDWKVYLHFNATFWHKVESLLGQETMRREVSQLKRLQAKLANTCLKDGGAVNPSKIKEPGLKPFQYGAAVIQGFNLRPHLDRQTKIKCQKLVTPELQYTSQLYTKQFPQLAAKLRLKAKVAASQH